MMDGNLFVIFPASPICKCPSAPVTPEADQGAWERRWRQTLLKQVTFSHLEQECRLMGERGSCKKLECLKWQQSVSSLEDSSDFCIVALHTWYCDSKLLILRITTPFVVQQPAAQRWWARLQTESQCNGWVVFLIVTRAVIKSYWSLTFPHSLSAPLSLGCRSHILWSHLSSLCCFFWCIMMPGISAAEETQQDPTEHDWWKGQYQSKLGSNPRQYSLSSLCLLGLKVLVKNPVLPLPRVGSNSVCGVL